METYEDRLLVALDTTYRELREDNHVAPNEILVFDVASGQIESIDLMELPLRYPCGPGNRWSYEDLGHVVADKALLYRQSMLAHEISDEDAEAEPTCGTVALVITEDHRAYRRLQIKSRIVAGG